MKTIQKKKFIDLFSGIGGFHAAAQRYGMECTFACDIDSHARKTYKSWYGIEPAADIIPYSEQSSKQVEFGDFDMLFAGFPCQPFSYAGANLGFEDKTRGTLFFHTANIIRQTRPAIFILENVKGLKSHDKGRTLSTIHETLNELDYTIFDTILDSLNFGVPQKRERWFCVGFDNRRFNISDFKFTESVASATTLTEIIDFSADNDVRLGLSRIELDKIDYHFENQRYFNDGRVKHEGGNYQPGSKKLRHGVYSYLKPNKTLRFHIGDTAKTQIQELYFVHSDTYSPAIIANRRPKLWDRKRYLSVGECLALQGFDASLEFPVSDAQAYKQLGNAVCVNVVASILNDIDLCIAGLEAKDTIKRAC